MAKRGVGGVAVCGFSYENAERQDISNPSGSDLAAWELACEAALQKEDIHVEGVLCSSQCLLVACVIVGSVASVCSLLDKMNQCISTVVGQEPRELRAQFFDIADDFKEFQNCQIFDISDDPLPRARRGRGRFSRQLRAARAPVGTPAIAMARLS